MLAVALLVLLKQALLHALAECCGKDAEMIDKSTAKSRSLCHVGNCLSHLGTNASAALVR
jgi:hypothetical protein